MSIEDTSTKPGMLYNWSRSVRIGPLTSVVNPHMESEVRALVRTTRTTRKSIRIVGGCSSNSKWLSDSTDDGIIVDLSGMHGLLRITDDTATFAAGTQLREVFDILSNRGRMLPCSPDIICSQTFAGAIGTGAHGQGLEQSSIADVVTSLRVVGAEGEVWDCDWNHPWFGALQLHLGCLGIITEITLRTVPSALFTCLKFVVDTQVLCDNYVNWNRQFSFCKVWWFPEKDQAHVWLVRPATADEARLADFSDVVGDISQILCKATPVPQATLEIAVPLQSFDLVQQALMEWYRIVRPKLHYQIILQSTGPSTAWLSPTNGRESCYYGFVAYFEEDEVTPNEVYRYLEEVQSILIRWEGRPHWGKYFNSNLCNWRIIYDKWNDFARVREKLDPRGRFANEFISQLFR